MKYKCKRPKSKDEQKGGDYWRDVSIEEHFHLAPKQTSYNYIIQNYSSSSSILEAGCGLGRWVIPLSEQGFDVTGIEIEKEAVEKVNDHYKSQNFRIIHGDIFNMPFKDKSFDIVISLGVLEHFEDRITQKNAISEHSRVLKDDGVFFVTVPYISLIRLIIHFPFIRLLSLVRSLKGKKEYFTEYRYTKSAFKKILKSDNFEITKIVWDDLQNPYSFGLTVDYPVKRFTKSKDGVQYKLNNFGLAIQKVLWKIHPGLISGGVGFVCKKNN